MRVPYQTFYTVMLDLNTKEIVDTLPNRFVKLPEQDCIIIDLRVGPNGLFDLVIKKGDYEKHFLLSRFQLRRKLRKYGFRKDVMTDIIMIIKDRHLNNRWT